MMTTTPFSVSPNPAALYITPSLRSALHKVRYTVDNRQGLTCVLGDAGMGKSSLMRLLHLDYESNTAKLLQIVMAGQIELRERLKLPRNKALRSRIVMYSLLSPLTLAEAKAMLEHRCSLAEIPLPFPDDVIDLIYSTTGGVPRDI